MGKTALQGNKAAMAALKQSDLVIAHPAPHELGQGGGDALIGLSRTDRQPKNSGIP